MTSVKDSSIALLGYVKLYKSVGEFRMLMKHCSVWEWIGQLVCS